MSGYTKILRLIIAIGLLILIVLGLVYLPFLSDKLTVMLPTSLGNADIDPKTRVDTFKVEVVKKSSSQPEEITEAYHLWLKVSFWNEEGEKIRKPSGRIIINGFIAPPQASDQSKEPEQIIMAHNLKKIIDLDKVLAEVNPSSSTQWTSQGWVILRKGNISIYLKSGIKIRTINYYISLTVEYDPSGLKSEEENVVRLTQNIPLFKY